jgi:hypothetical protein
MKSYLIIFGLLDLITVIRGYRFFINLVKVDFDFHWITLAMFLMYVSLIISGISLINKRKVGLWISYFQFPFRIYVAIFSFGFLMIINGTI